jgi:hypothetical protein
MQLYNSCSDAILSYLLSAVPTVNIGKFNHAMLKFLKVGMLKDFQGDKNKLGNAEKFLLALIVVPHYKLRLEGMIAKEDFKSTVDMLNEKIDVLLHATEGKDIMKIFIPYHVKGFSHCCLWIVSRRGKPFWVI